MIDNTVGRRGARDKGSGGPPGGEGALGCLTFCRRFQGAHSAAHEQGRAGTGVAGYAQTLSVLIAAVSLQGGQEDAPERMRGWEDGKKVG